MPGPPIQNKGPQGSRKAQPQQSSHGYDKINGPGAAGTSGNQAIGKQKQSSVKPVQPIEDTTAARCAKVLVMLARGAKILPQILVELWVGLMVCDQLLALHDDFGDSEFDLGKEMLSYNAKLAEKDGWKVKLYEKLSKIYRSFQHELYFPAHNDEERNAIQKELDALSSTLPASRKSRSDFYKHYHSVYTNKSSLLFNMDLHSRLERILPTVFALRIGILHDILLGTYMTLGTCFKQVYEGYAKQADPNELKLNLNDRIKDILKLVNSSKHHKELGDDPQEGTEEYLQTFTDLAKYIARDSTTNPLRNYKDYLQPVEEAEDCADTYDYGVEVITSHLESQQKIEELEKKVDQLSKRNGILEEEKEDLEKSAAVKQAEIATLESKLAAAEAKIAELSTGKQLKSKKRR